jgi:type I restriction enzyme S subunit
LGLENSPAKLLGKDTVVITARGTVGAIRMLGTPMSFNQTCYGLAVKRNFNPSFLYYALKDSINNIKSLSYGTVFETITKKTFDSLLIPFPPLSEQRAIAGVLGALDDKIELNRRMNRTLEEMAQAIFKKWFIDNEETKNWEQKPLDKIAEFLNGLPLQNYPVNGSENSLPVIKITQLRKGI